MLNIIIWIGAIVAILLLIYIAVGIRITVGHVARLRKEWSEMQNTIDRLRASVVAQTAVVTSAVALVAGMVEKLRESADDPDEINALADSLEANTASLAQAVAIATPAATEVPAEDGGEGSDDLSVDPDAELEPAAEDGAGTGAGGDQGGGEAEGD